jgi:hypothetical protein
MKHLLLPCLVVFTLAACSSEEAAQSPVQSVDAGESDTGSQQMAFDLNGARLAIYEVDGGSEFCINQGDILDFTLNLNTSDATIGVAVVGDSATDSCINEPASICMIREEHRIQVTQTQRSDLLALIGAIPAPMCVVDAGRVCDFCLVETLLVDSQTVDTDCCGDLTPNFRPTLASLVAYVQNLVPTPAPPIARAFSNPSAFKELEYSTGGLWGYCPQEGTVTGALITRSTTDQKLSIRGARATIGDRATDTCLEDTWHDDNCYVATPFGPLVLDEDQETALEDALAAMPAATCVEDPGLACDPCLLHGITVDRVFVDDACCGTMTPEYWNGLSAIIDVIESLTP